MSIPHLQDEAHEGNHGEAAILDLLGLQLLGITLAEAQGVEHTTGVAHLGVGHLVALEDGVLDTQKTAVKHMFNVCYYPSPYHNHTM